MLGPNRLQRKSINDKKQKKRQSSKFLNPSQGASSIDSTESLSSTDVQSSDSNENHPLARIQMIENHHGD